MIALDHTIVRVSDLVESVAFYVTVLGFQHLGWAAPFHVIRVNESLTLDLMHENPADRGHLAFSMDRATFDALHDRLIQANIPFGGQPFERQAGPPGKALGAKGTADALYFFDPSGHNLEIRTYQEPSHADPDTADHFQ